MNGGNEVEASVYSDAENVTVLLCCIKYDEVGRLTIVWQMPVRRALL